MRTFGSVTLGMLLLFAFALPAAGQVDPANLADIFEAPACDDASEPLVYSSFTPMGDE